MNFINIFIKIKEKTKELFSKNKKLFFVSLALLFVLMALFLFPKNKTNSVSTKTNSISNLNSYIGQMESKIQNMLLRLSSIKNAEVLLIVDGSEQKEYLTQKEASINGDIKTEKEEVVFEKNGSSQVPIEICVHYPKIKSVLIVLNKTDASTKNSIRNAVAGVLNIDQSCIFILQDG